jgi:ABC-type uncharacterized transport system ATPase subunit
MSVRNLLEMRGITKKFPRVIADDKVDFDLRGGEIHALLGENGAGKSTLMKVLYGMYPADGGEIFVEGRRVEIKSPKDAIRLGIGMVHQHFTLVSTMTVAQNVVLGTKSRRAPLLDLKQAEKGIAELERKYGLHVNPKAIVWQLSVGEQQRVEIVKALFKGARILILDEPTAVLTPSESLELMTVLRRMTGEGSNAVVFITHKLREVFAASDRVTVLKSGKLMGTLETKSTDAKTLAKMMVGREVLLTLDKSPTEQGEPVLEVENLRSQNDKGLPALRGVTFTVRSGEILGIAGVSGNGQSELAEVICGLRKATEGKVTILNKGMTNTPVRDIMALGVGYIPEDRIGTGLVMDFSLEDNLLIETFDRAPYARKWIVPSLGHWMLDRNQMRRQAENLMKEFQVIAPNAEVSTRNLSGGNLQRLILARELAKTPKLLIASQPTRGLDVGATEYIRKRILEQRSKGLATLLISEDLDEITSMSDRIAVIFEGEIMGIVPASEAKVEEIGLMMAGKRQSELSTRNSD